MTNKEYYKNKYYLQLKEMAKFPVWTRLQINCYLHISNKMLINLVDENIIYKFNIARCTFYTTKNKTFTNQAIIKSIMEIDSVYRVHYDEIDNFTYDDKLEEKSLISRNVRKVGTNFKVDYFNVYNINPSVKYDKIVDLMVDIENMNDKPVLIMIYLHHIDIEDLKNYIEERLITYLMSGRMEYILIDVNYPHLSYIQL